MGRRRKGLPISGWIVLDKPLGMSSSQAVGAVRRITGAAKAGHAGTLDPLASGVLPIALGEATKTVAFAMAGRKTYRFTVRWGEARSTDDAEGEVVAASPVRPDEAAIRAVLPRFTGTILQRPPAYSAIKVEGRRAYALARAASSCAEGGPVLAARPIEIEALRLVRVPDADRAEFEAVVGKGTYVRSLARDLAEALGTVGHVAALRRTAVGALTETRAIPLDKLAALGHRAAASEHLLPIATVLDDIPALAVTEAEAERLRRGQPIAFPSAGAPEGTQVCVTSGDAIVALAQIEAGRLRPVRVLNPDS
jgi:tRNA pseudouridine55 synthase